MEFEVFKKSYFMGDKNITDEELAICKKQYSSYLLKIEDEEFFEPFYGNNMPFSDNYFNQLLGNCSFNEHKIMLLIQPSFEPESLIIIEKCTDRYVLSCKTSEVQYWTKLFDKEGIIEEKLKTYASNLDKKGGDSLWQLINKAIIEARPPKSNFFTLDGTIYILIQMIDGEVVKVSKNLTNDNSKTGKIIALIDTLNTAIKTNSIDLIQETIQQKNN